MSHRRKARLAAIVLSGIAGLCLLGLAALALAQLLPGRFALKLHWSERYGLFATAPALTGLVAFGIGGFACVWRAIALWRQRCRGKV